MANGDSLQLIRKCHKEIMWEITKKSVGGAGNYTLIGPSDWEHGGASVIADKDRNQFNINLSLTSTVPLYIKKQQNRIILSPALDSLGKAGDFLDVRGIYSLLQFGTIIPPFSPWRDVQRIVPGFGYALEFSTGCLVKGVAGLKAQSIMADDVRSESQIDPVAQVVSCIDAFLCRNCPDGKAVILFSGGVDSGLIAARAAALGWKDAVLVNYAMDREDPEAQHAERMARYLGLRYERIDHDELEVMSILPTLARTCPQPFADHSIFPTRCLCNAVIKQYENTTIFDGTGADGCFGLFGRLNDWSRIYQIPLAIRKVAVWLYRALKSWEKPTGIERYLRLVGRSADMPLLPATVAQNPLCGILYKIDREIRNEVHAAMEEWLHEALPADEPRVQLVGADLAVICANIFAQKSQPLFGVDDKKILYPFLDNKMVALALTEAFRWPGSERPKEVLKKALARHVPEEMVYRQKSGFAAPIERLFQQKPFLEAFDQLLDSASPLARYLNRTGIEKLGQLLQSGRILPAQTANAAWALVAANLWLQQAGMTKS